MWVAELSAEPLMANRISGKTIGKTMSARWRSVRTADRRATAKVCSTTPAPRGSRTCAGGPRTASTATSTPAAAFRLLLLLIHGSVARTLKLAPRLGQEDVIQRGLVQLQRFNAQPRLVEESHHVGQLALAGRKLDRDAALPVAVHVAETRQQVGQSIPGAGIGGCDLKARAADLGLELGGGSPGHGAAPVNGSGAG